MTLICRNFELNDTNVLKQVECMLSQQECSPVISKSNVNYILAVFSGVFISRALAADASMEQQTVVIPEGIGGWRSLYST